MPVGFLAAAPGAAVGTPNAPGSDRWDAPAHRSMGSDGGSIRRYSPQTLDQIRKHVVTVTGGALPMPQPVLHAALDYPEILPGAWALGKVGHVKCSGLGCRGAM